jgi:two-component system phosphate regulon response regulator PhoB
MAYTSTMSLDPALQPLTGVPSPSRDSIIIVEDEAPMLEMLTYGLMKEGFAVQGARSGEEGLALVGAKCPALVVLDLMLPGIDGLEVCRRLKADPGSTGVAILMLTARDGETDIVTGLELGADDYLTKPFSLGVLAARIRAVLRRREAPAAPADPERVAAGEIVLDRRRREVLVGGGAVDLTVTEFEILWLLAGHPGTVFTRSRIVDAVRGSEAAITERAIDVRLVGLRRKLGDAAGRIETVRGVGYRFGD